MPWEEYQKKLIDLGYRNENLDLVKKAYLYACEMHSSQKRASGDAYITHPTEVSLKVATLKLDAATIAASLLHDIVEDHAIALKEIKKLFGEEIMRLVEGVTKVDKVQYRGVARAIESLRKMFLATAEDIRVVIIKLLDRVHNMETIQYLDPEKQKRISLETLELYAPLADRIGMWKIKAELEDLAFPIVYPEEFAWLILQLKDAKIVREKYLEKLKPLAEGELKKEHIEPIEIVYRAKHLYSIWKKLLRNEMNIDRIMDLVAMKIIVNNVEDCYRALGILHNVWRPLPGHIKDFIALPKPNGYQSLHTYVIGPEGKVVSMHIRTKEMDDEASNGIAAHWFYEIEGKKEITKKIDEKRFSWVRRLKDWQSGYPSQSHDEILSALKIDFFKDRIFVLTPKGDVIDLPEGATPVDFAYHVHSEIGDHMFGAKVNGKMVPFSHKLKSGETIEILTQKNKKPTSDWLDFTKTTAAKHRIRASLRKAGIIKTPEKELLEMTINAHDRVGLLKDYTATFAKFKINILDIKMDNKNKSFSKIIFRFNPNKSAPSIKILTALKNVAGTEDVVMKKVK